MFIHGDGSVTRLEKKPRSKCRRWRLRVKTDKGEKAKRFRGTYLEAKEELARYRNDLSNDKKPTTFREYAETWLNRRRTLGDIAYGTLEKNKRQIKTIDKVFGDLQLTEITKGVAIDGLARVKAGENASGKTLSGTYLNHIYTTMKAIFEEAVEDKLIETNPLARVKAPKLDTEERKAVPQNALLHALQVIEASPLTAYLIAVLIAVLAGLRRGEIIALRWCDIIGDTIRVCRSFDEKSGKIKSPKTASGVRNVPLIARLKTSLEMWKEIQRDQLAAIGIEQTEETPIVTAANGEYMYPQNLARWWRKNAKNYGLEGYVLHELRHTFLTMLANSGANVWALQHIGGWANVRPASTYVHDDEAANAKAVAHLDEEIENEMSRKIKEDEESS